MDGWTHGWMDGLTDGCTEKWTDGRMNEYQPPGRTCPQSCKVNDVRLFSVSTRTTLWLKPCMLSTPRPDVLEPWRPGLKKQQFNM